jgi:hypothetical protein
VFENRMLRRISGPKREEMAGSCRTLHNEELRNLYTSPNIIRVIKWRRMIWLGHVAHMEDVRRIHKILGKYCGKERTGFIWLTLGTSGGLL